MLTSTVEYGLKSSQLPPLNGRDTHENIWLDFTQTKICDSFVFAGGIVHGNAYLDIL
jgi:hypothetical protein